MRERLFGRWLLISHSLNVPKLLMEASTALQPKFYEVGTNIP